MPKQRNNIVMAGFRGALNKQIVFRQRNGVTFISTYPDMSGRVLSEKQIKVNKTMMAANKYAKDTIDDETFRNAAQLRLDVPSNKLYTSLVREFFKLQKEKEQEKQ